MTPAHFGDATSTGRLITIGPVGAEVEAPEALSVIAIGYADSRDPFHSWVTDTNVELFERLRDLVAEPPGHGGRLIAVLVIAPPVAGDDPNAVAAVESVRGAVLSLATELGPSVHLNVVVTDHAENAAATLRYLAGADAGYVTGSTFDLREAV